MNNQSSVDPLDVLLKLKINHSKVKEVSKLSGSGDFKFHLVCDNKKEYLLRAFNYQQYLLNHGKEEYNYFLQYQLLTWLHKYTDNVPIAFKPFRLQQLNWYCLLLQWMPGISLNQVILINWDEIEYIAESIKELEQLIHGYCFKQANQYHHKHHFIIDRKNRLYDLISNYYSQINADENKKNLYKLLIHQLKHHWSNLCFSKYSMNHGDLNFLKFFITSLICFVKNSKVPLIFWCANVYC